METLRSVRHILSFSGGMLRKLLDLRTMSILQNSQYPPGMVTVLARGRALPYVVVPSVGDSFSFISLLDHNSEAKEEWNDVDERK
jgi:hypothetical protein